MKLLTFRDYTDYRQQQIETNQAKLDWVAATEQEMRLITRYVRRMSPQAKFGLCHGVRNGWEVEQLRKLLDIDVLGTDISPTVGQFANCRQWDFHEIDPAWFGVVDFIYSNALDHSFDPRLALTQWRSCLRSGGFCFVQWTHHDNTVGGADCFGATKGEYISLLSELFDSVECVNAFSVYRRTKEWLRDVVTSASKRQCYLMICRR